MEINEGFINKLMVAKINGPREWAQPWWYRWWDTIAQYWSRMGMPRIPVLADPDTSGTSMDLSVSLADGKTGDEESCKVPFSLYTFGKVI